MDDYPMRNDSYMEGLLKEGWEKKQTEYSTLTDFSDVSTLVSCDNHKNIIMLINSFQIFHHVIRSYKKMDEEKKQYTPTIPGAWNTRKKDLILLKFRSLFIKSKNWKSLVNKIRTKVMPVWPK